VIETEIGGNSAAVREALKWMAAKAWIDVRKEGQAHRHYLTDAGRGALTEGER
jgi:DNA-binding transcriptional regulator PaaX